MTVNNASISYCHLLLLKEWRLELKWPCWYFFILWIVFWFSSFFARAYSVYFRVLSFNIPMFDFFRKIYSRTSWRPGKVSFYIRKSVHFIRIIVIILSLKICFFISSHIFNCKFCSKPLLMFVFFIILGNSC